MSYDVLVDTPEVLPSHSPRVEDLIAAPHLHAEQSVGEKAAAIRLKEVRRMRAQSLKLAGYNLQRLGICECGDLAQPPAKHCAACAKKIFDDQEAKRAAAATQK